MVPPVPPDAPMVALPQNVPPPEPVTAPGVAFTDITIVEKQLEGVV